MNPFFQKIFYVPINHSESSENDILIRQLHLTQICAIFAIFSYLIYILLYLIIGYELLLPMIINLLVFLIPYFFVFYAVRTGKFNLAKLLVIVPSNLSIIIGAGILLGKSPGIHLFFLLFTIFPILAWSKKNIGLKVILIAIGILSFIFVEFVMKPEQAYIIYPIKYISITRNFALITSFSVVACILWIYTNLVENKELMLHEKSVQLEVLNSELTKNSIELSETLKIKDKFVSILAHDLKNPLNALIGFTDLLLTKYNSLTDEKKKQIIKTLLDSAQLSAEFVENMLLWTRLHTGRLSLNPENIIVKLVIDEQIKLLLPVLENKQLTIQNHINPSLSINTDKFLFTIVTNNLISNAIKFTKPNGAIQIDAKNLEEFFEFCFHDNGVGISTNDIDKIFNPDEQFSMPGTNNERGTGMGLSLCKEFIELSGGEIWVESELNKGSKFYFTLNKSKVK